MALGPLDFVFAGITGLSVVLVTLLADRLGGRIGGLLATAPVTTTAAHIVIATSVAPELASARVLAGVAALLASTFGIVAFFYTVKFTRGNPSHARLVAGLAVYLAIFFGLTVLLAAYPLHPLPAFVLLFGVHAVLAFSFMREPVPVLRDYVPRAVPRTVQEYAARFAAGAVVVLVIRELVDVYPPLAGALAVVPAIFVVSLTVMGVRQNAPFAARAAQAGLFGTTAVAVFVLVIAATLALQLPGGVWPGVPVAWLAYMLTLAALGRVHQKLVQ